MSLSKKIKIAIGIIAFVLITAYVVKSIIYKPHALIEQQDSVYKGDALDFLKKIKVDASQWQDKIVELSGKITSKDEQGLMLNTAIYCQLKMMEDLSSLSEGQEVSIKGRIIGYDDLLEELKLDKTIIINTKK
jgi:hypothetical protein